MIINKDFLVNETYFTIKIKLLIIFLITVQNSKDVKKMNVFNSKYKLKHHFVFINVHFFVSLIIPKEKVKIDLNSKSF